MVLVASLVHFSSKMMQGATVTVNGIRYRAMIKQFLFLKINDIDADNIWFQQDGAACHTANETINSLKEKFGESIISRNGLVNCATKIMRFNTVRLLFMGLCEVIVLCQQTTNN